jgi:Dolichyl-phosphate-mannose-protein mannosyltransferase
MIVSILLFIGIFMQGGNLDQSFWFDEVWVANAVAEPTFSQMMYYEGWLNTNPPLFLFFVRLFTVFDISHTTMRLVPFLFGIVSILGIAYLAVRLLKPWYALTAVLLFCLSPTFVFYATALKPYATDTFVAVILLIIGYHYSVTASRKAFTTATLAFAVLGFLSYQAIVFLPFFIIAASLEYGKTQLAAPHRPPRWLDIALLCSCAAVVSAINYFYFIEPNRGDALLEFWKIGYQGSNFLGFVRYVTIVFATLTTPFFFPINPYLPVNIVVVAIVGLGWSGFLLTERDGTRGSWHIAMLLGLPVLSLSLLNLLGQYPIHTRLVLFLFPAVTILFVSGIQVAVDLCLRGAAKLNIIPFTPIKMEALLGPTIFVGTTCLFVARLAVAGPQPYLRGEPVEDAVGAIRYLSQEHGNRDLLYVHSTMYEHYKFYTKHFPITMGRVIQGKIGSPCCPRDYFNDRGLSASDVMPAELARLEMPGNSITVRLLLTDRPDHWYSFIRRDEPYEFEKGLTDKGCFRAETKKFKGIQIQEYNCGPNRSL